MLSIKKISNVLLIIGIMLLGANCVIAETDNLRVRSNNVLPPNFISKISAHQEIPIKYKTQLYIPGLGNIKIRLTHERFLLAAPTINSKLDLGQIPTASLYQGQASSKNGNFPIAAQAEKKANQHYLNLSFLTPKQNSKFYNIKINFDRRIARIHQKISEQPINCAQHHKNNLITSGEKILNQTIIKKYQLIDLSLDADQAWYQKFGSNSNNKMLALINATDVIYANELGLKFNIKRSNVSTNQSFGSLNASSKLNSFLNFTANQSYFGKSDIYYLFTGESLQLGVAGIGTVGTVCTSFAVPAALSSYLNDQITPLVIAHEIGHVMGADHDQTGNCGSSNSIMQAVIAPPYPNTFSSCSKTAFAEQLLKYGNCFDEEESSAPEDSKIISLTGSVSKLGVIRFNLDLKEDLLNCAITLRAAKTRTKLNSALSIGTFPLGIGTLLIKRNLSASSINPKAIVYLRANLECSGTSASSNIIKLSPYKIISSKKVSTSSWIKLLKNKLKSF